MIAPAASIGHAAAALPRVFAAGVFFSFLSAPTPVPPPPPLSSSSFTSAEIDFWSNAAPFAPLPGPRLVPAADVRSAETARGLNARTPFAATPFRLAPAFHFSGTSDDRARAADCLAAAAYYEAGRDEPGQRAVVQVVLNRVRNPIYPRSICGVVFQGSERSTGCQFTFTCDGSMARRRPSPDAWNEAERVANQALDGYSDASVGHATHYHTDWVHPYWSSSLDKIAAVRTHLFFQARAERPGDFSSFYAGKEPRIGALAGLSTAHATGEELASMAALPTVTVEPVNLNLALPAMAPPPAPARERLPDRSALPDDGIFLVTLDKSAGADSFRQMGENLCAGRDQCKLIGWTDDRKRPARFPIPGSAIDTISFVFTRHNTSASDKVQWNCQEFPRANSAECLNLSR